MDRVLASEANVLIYFRGADRLDIVLKQPISVFHAPHFTLVYRVLVVYLWSIITIAFGNLATRFVAPFVASAMSVRLAFPNVRP